MRVVGGEKSEVGGERERERERRRKSDRTRERARERERESDQTFTSKTEHGRDPLPATAPQYRSSLPIC